MSPDERVRVARLSYLRAVAAARARSSAYTWRRLLTAARNVHAAVRDRDRSSAGPSAPVLLHMGPPTPQRSVAHGAVGALATPSPLPARLAPSAMETEWLRARALVAWSRRLVRESHTLCSELAALKRRRSTSPA
jgi:hypothetical protein